MSSKLFERYKGMLDLASSALATRGTFSAFPHRSRDYNDLLETEGRQALDNYRDSIFYLDQPASDAREANSVRRYVRGAIVSIDYALAEKTDEAARATVGEHDKAGGSDGLDDATVREIQANVRKEGDR